MIAAALLEQGIEVPDDVLPVDVWSSAQPYLTAFDVLSAARGQSSNGWQAIEYHAITEYADRNGFGASIVELEEFVSLIQAQDAEWLKHANKPPATGGR
jgi:hypothetical protein